MKPALPEGLIFQKLFDQDSLNGSSIFIEATFIKIIFVKAALVKVALSLYIHKQPFFRNRN